MEPEAYRLMAQTEDEHWWYEGRRAIVANVIETLRLPRPAAILEIGAGTGGNLKMLAKYGDVQALEPDAFARAWAAKKTKINIVAGELPGGVPFRPGEFDLICLFDVLEHLEDDITSLQAAARLLAPRGKICLTVPANQWLWSSHDEHLHHFRRYSNGRFLRVISKAGLRVNRVSYFNTLLFPLAVMVRVLDRLVGKRASGTGKLPFWINTCLKHILYIEGALLRRYNLPFGVSLIGIIELGSEPN